MGAVSGSELAGLDFKNMIGGPLVAAIEAQSLAAEATARFIKETGFYPIGQKDIDDNDIGNTPIYVDFKYPKEVQPYKPGRTFFKVDSIEIVNGGTGYPAGTTLTFSPAVAQGETTAVGTITPTTGVITAVTITTNGVYLTPPSISISGPAAATDTSAILKVIMAVHHEETPVPAVYQEMKISVPILTMLPIPFIQIDIITIDFNAKINSIETESSSSDLTVNATLDAGYGGKRAYVKVSGSVAYKKSNAKGSTEERTFSMAIHAEASQADMPPGMEKLLQMLESAMKSTPGDILPA